MPEIRDIYDRFGQRTGRTFAKGEALAAGEFFLHTVVLLRGRGGKYLLQQRSLKARHFPGKWDTTGGGVQTGEESRAAAAREVCEELGLALDPQTFVYGGRIFQDLSGGRGYWLDMYGAAGDFAEEDCTLSPREVHAVRLVDFDEYERTVAYNKDAAFMAVQAGLHARMEEMARGEA